MKTFICFLKRFSNHTVNGWLYAELGTALEKVIEWCEREHGYMAEELGSAAQELIDRGESTEEGCALRRAFRRELLDLLVWHQDTLGTLEKIDETIVFEGEENDE